MFRRIPVCLIPFAVFSAFSISFLLSSCGQSNESSSVSFSLSSEAVEKIFDGGGRSNSKASRALTGGSEYTLEISVYGEDISVSRSYTIKEPETENGGKNPQVFTIDDLPSEISVSVNVSVFRDGNPLWKTKKVPTILLYPGDNFVNIEMIKTETPDTPDNPDPENPSITDAEYTVKHLVQKLSEDKSSVLNEYIARETEKLSGKIGEETSASLKEYEGFTAQSFEQKTVNADGSTVVEIKYERKTVTLTFNYDDGKGGSGTVSGKYGTSVSAPQNPTRTGYTFSGWSSEVPATFPAENQTFTAQWTFESAGSSSGSIKITAEDDLEALLSGTKKEDTNDMSLSTSGETAYSITVSDVDGKSVALTSENTEVALYNGGVKYADTSVQATVSAANTITISGAVAPGSYQLLVTFSHNGKTYQVTFDLSAKETL